MSALQWYAKYDFTIPVSTVSAKLRPCVYNSAIHNILRLIYFLDKHNLLSIYQSGFRSKRQTTDNLLFLSQKTLEAKDSGNYTCGVVFDIHKAFDKVWQNCLIFKLSKINLPKKLR